MDTSMNKPDVVLEFPNTRVVRVDIKVEPTSRISKWLWRFLRYTVKTNWIEVEAVNAGT